jgi:signal transduction histidine kinase
MMKRTTENSKGIHFDVLLASPRSDDYRAVSSAVEEMGGRVFTGYSIETVLRFAENQDFAIALIDKEFPEIGAFQALLALRNSETAKNLPVLVIADADPENRKEMSAFYAMGAMDYLDRPLDPFLVKNKIHVFIELFRMKKKIGDDRHPSPDGNSENMNRVVAELAGGIAHQFNNTLNIITGHVELLRMDMADSQPVASFSNVIFDSVRKMTALTDKLLAYARTGNNQTGRLELNELISAGLNGSCYDRERISVASDLDPGNILIDADGAQIRMVFSALFRNAVEAIRDSGKIMVRTRYIPGGERRGHVTGPGYGNVVCIEVRDTGEGMTREVSERIFEPFFTTKFQGRGLDMAAAQGIVTSHGGWIDVKSYPGEGTTVSVFLPVSSYRKIQEFAVPDNFAKDTGPFL